MRLLGRELGLAVALAASVAAGAARADDFTDKVLQAFRARDAQLRVTARSDDELEISGPNGPTRMYLYNLRGICSSQAGRCDAEVASFVQVAVGLAASDQPAMAFADTKVYPTLRSAGFGRRAGERFKDDADKQLVVLPFGGGMELLFVVDSEKAVRFVNRGEMAKAGLTEKALRDLGARNAARLAPPPYSPIKGMQALKFMVADDGLGASRLFDAALWDKVEAAEGGPVAVVVPTRDWIVFTRADRTEEVSRMRELAARIVRGEPYAVSDAVLIRQAGGWTVQVSEFKVAAFGNA